MRLRSTDDENDDIMDASEALSRADDMDDQLNFLENEMAAVKKTPAEKKTPAVKTAKAPAQKKVKDPSAPKGVFGPRAVPEGHVGLGALATELGITPSVARRNLRGMEGMTKPEGQHGWYWKEGSKDLGAVRKALSA